MDDPISEFKAWYRRLPAFSRTFISASFILVVLYSFGLVNAYYLYYDPSLTFKKLQLWRTITAFLFFGKFSFNYLITMYFAYFAISKVEVQLFDRRNYADFLWLVVYLWGFILLAATLFGQYFTGESFIFAFLYIWCKRKPFETITFFFGLQVKSGYFPLVFMGFNVLMGQSLIIFLIGLFFGHLYIHVKDVLTVKYRKDYLPTPTFFSNFVKKYITKEIRAPNANAAGPRREQQPQQRFFGGQGVRIG